LAETLRAVEQAVAELGARGCDHDQDASKVSVVGLGMATRPGVAGTMFRALAEKGINIQMISTSQIKISVVVARAMAEEALRAVHEAFELRMPPAGHGGHRHHAAAPLQLDAGQMGTVPFFPPATPLQLDAAKLVARLQRMDELIIEGIELDQSQCRITFPGLPNIPGLAAQTFDELAEAGVVVDMIVQSVSRGDRVSISLTVPRADLRRAIKAAKELTESLACAPPTHSPNVAKVSVFGVGMRSHTGVAARMFQALAAAGINVEMISTSEVCINVVVDGRHGEAALAALRTEFAEAMV
jgi:aspartate kinase